MPKINPSQIPKREGSKYPYPFNQACKNRIALDLGNGGGLTQFGAVMVTLPPPSAQLPSWSSQRHWHSVEDEFVYVISGDGVLVDDDGETELVAGDVCTHKAGDGNAHHIQNQSEADFVYLVVGGRNPETDYCRYPDIDLDLPPNGTSRRVQSHNDGRPYK